jgi:hypothetical protein
VLCLVKVVLCLVGVSASRFVACCMRAWIETSLLFPGLLMLRGVVGRG